jgi:formylglycine-generating enzyme required for sulfatase activity
VKKTIPDSETPVSSPSAETILFETQPLDEAPAQGDPENEIDEPPPEPSPDDDDNSEETDGSSSALLLAFGGILLIVAIAFGVWRPWGNEQIATTSPTATPTTTPKQSPSPSITPSIAGIEFIRIAAGSFTMGSSGFRTNEQPPHRVEIPSAFEIGKYEITQAQWKIIMDGQNPSAKTGDDLPVTNITWFQAEDFTKRLTKMDGQSVYRLPTEAEWEYCARAGSDRQAIDNLDELAWYGLTEGPRPVGRLKPNAWGVYDMLGNVSEWCEDDYKKYFEIETTTDLGKIFRGCGWNSASDRCRPADRAYTPPQIAENTRGLRIVRIKRSTAK